MSLVVVEQYVQRALDLAKTVYILSRGEVAFMWARPMRSARTRSTRSIWESKPEAGRRPPTTAPLRSIVSLRRRRAMRTFPLAFP